MRSLAVLFCFLWRSFFPPRGRSVLISNRGGVRVSLSALARARFTTKPSTMFETTKAHRVEWEDTSVDWRQRPIPPPFIWLYPSRHWIRIADRRHGGR
jgi:hypothetical protein